MYLDHPALHLNKNKIPQFKDPSKFIVWKEMMLCTVDKQNKYATVWREQRDIMLKNLLSTSKESPEGFIVKKYDITPINYTKGPWSGR